jgi:hypothetical protein
MQAEVGLIASSPWLAVVSGVSSVLGCLLAVYSVQISGIEPSVYRGLIWEKTLLWSAGLGIIVASIVQIYGEAVRNPESPVGQMIYSLPALTYESTPRAQVTVEGPVTATSMPTANPPAGTGNTGGPTTNIQSGAGNIGGTITRTQSGGNNDAAQEWGIGPGGPSANVRLVTGINVSPGGNPGPEYRADGVRFWLITLLIGLVLTWVGYAKDPFKATTEKLNVGSQNLWTPAALRFSKPFPPFR